MHPLLKWGEKIRIEAEYVREKRRVIEAGLQNRDPLPVEAVGRVPDRARPERKFWLSAAANSWSV